jgi:lysophospholipase L1-like esterase
VSDPVFGSPNPKQVKIIAEERGGLASPEPHVEAMLKFTALWTSAIAQLCAAHDIPLVLAHDSTFFEKREPSAQERAWDLGVPHMDWERRCFANHRAVAPRFYKQRERTADQLGVPLIGPGASNDLSFIDEFHFDEVGARQVADELAAAIRPLLRS